MEGKVLHEINIRKATLLISSSLAYRISSWLLELLSQVTCCLARVLQAENSPFLRGTSSATPERFFHILSKKIFSVVSSSYISISRWCVFLEDTKGEAEWWFWHLSKRFWLGEILKRRLWCFTAIWVSFWARGESYYSMGFFHFLGQHKRRLLSTHGRWRLRYWGWFLSRETRETLVEVIATFLESLRGILLEYW